MKSNKNILILSVGTRNKIVEYFKDNISGGKVIATDMSEYAPGLYEADKYYITSSISDPNYLHEVIKICEIEEIDAVFSLIDPELSLLAENKDKFDKKNILLLQSNKELIDLSFNKFKFFNKLNSLNYNSQKSFIDYTCIVNELEKNGLEFPLFVKPNTGSASININRVNDIETLNNLCKKHEDLIIQEYVEGIEYGVDVYVDIISKKVISIFIKEKIKMRAGETDKSISVKDNKLFELIEKFVVEMGYSGHIDIDIFRKNDTFYISEVNPRFGGGYPHAYESGCNFPKYIINNINGLSNEPEIGKYKEGTVMMKYNEIKYLEKK